MTVTARSSTGSEPRQRTYVACLNCGEELAYDWHKMKIAGRSRDIYPAPATLVSIASKSATGYGLPLPAECRSLASHNLTNIEAGRQVAGFVNPLHAK